MFRHIKKIASTTSDRVKAVEFHPREPLLAEALYNGTVQIFNTNNMTILKTILVDRQNKPLRCIRFIPSLQWIITGGDGLTISCFDYNTCSLTAQYENAHKDLIRQIAVHPTQLLVLSCSDDYTINSYTINKNSLVLERVFEGHSHFVMDVKFNPKDPSTFATVSLDCTIKIWGLTSSTARLTLKGHKSGVNCIEFFPGSDKPYIATGADDFEIRIWDYQTKSCVATLPGHGGNITALKFHPTYPLLFSTSEDEMLLVWNTLTMSNETVLNYQKKRGWCIDATKEQVAIGFDEGLVVLKVGRDSSTIITIDNNGRVFWARNNEIQSANLNQASFGDNDGESVDLTIKDVANSEFFPSSIAYNSTGRYVAIYGDGEYAVYSALAWRVKSYGNSKEFVWGIGDTFAIKKNQQTVAVTTTFSNTIEIQPPLDIDRIFGGSYLGISGEDEIIFYTWDNHVIGLIIVNSPITGVYWSNVNSLVAISTTESLFILQLNEEYEDLEDYNEETGSESAFTLITQFDKVISRGSWYNEVFFFNDKNTIYMCIGNYIEVISRVDKALTLVGYVSRIERLFLCDSDYNFFSYSVPSVVLDFIISITFDENNITDSNISNIPKEWHSRISSFLESIEHYEEALKLCDNDDKRFELAIKLNDINLGIQIAKKSNSLYQWKLLTNVAMKNGDINVLEESLKKSGDENALLLIKSAKGNKNEMRKFAEDVEDSRNVKFAAYFACADYDKCIDLLIEDKKFPEAALMARSYVPKRMEECALLWKDFLAEKGEKRIADSIALPSENPNMFGINEDEVKKEEENGNDDVDDLLQEANDNKNSAAKEQSDTDLQELLDVLDDDDEDLFK
ncbi:coatomer subunit beta' [Histomonas meleagridis]|uniref:coatomer subunit beta' n=1 Tax=Histomonas meleagridis TaxID=135588 RepID=UPI003559B627|nr:coatomer subunit beta' [Histomonas meleagridis]KAH0801729.1 coatomer subunit beta' [Histomonas meleagridis]